LYGSPCASRESEKKRAKTRTTVTQTSPNATQIKSEMEVEPGNWVPLGEDACKKQAGSAA
jgi:hypothetical protein